MPVGSRNSGWGFTWSLRGRGWWGWRRCGPILRPRDRAQQTHDRLDDFLLIYDELNDNIDTYVDRKNDIRKPLKVIIDADTEFQAKLRALKDAAGVPAEEVRAIRVRS